METEGIKKLGANCTLFNEDIVYVLLKNEILMNGFYGACGQYSCLYYNLNVASSVTTQGRSLISSAGLQFEMFLANNVKFGSLDEVITFIHNVIKEERVYNDNLFLDRNISKEECFYKVMMTCGFNYVPSESDLEIVWDIIYQLPQEDINRLYYKNNLYEFMNNSSMKKAFIYMITHLQSAYLDPNEAPDEIKVELLEFRDILMEYVYYHHQILDRLDKYDNMYRSICIITDTDSTIISLDAWYRFGLDLVKDIDMPIKHQLTDPFIKLNIDEFGDRELEPLFREIDAPTDYSFYRDEVIQLEKSIDPLKVIPQEGVRYSIINILAFCLGHIINDYMERYTQNSNSYKRGKKCLISMKNEFLFKRALLTPAKKNYATIQEIQEGNVVKKSKQLDIKGLMIGKASLTPSTQKALQKIMYEDILNSKEVDQIAVLKELAKFEKHIFNAIQSGSKEFFKPIRVKAISSYEDPMRQQGIKASVVYNTLRNNDMEAIDLTERNSVDIVKVDINPKNIDHLKIEEPELYSKIVSLLQQKEFKKDGITTIAIPKNEQVPQWLFEFINYNTIISDNAKHLPIESLGIYRGNDNSNYTNIVKLV